MKCTTTASKPLIVIDLPRPPSLNRLWRYGRGRVYRSKAYTDWLRWADGEWLAQKPKGPVKTLLEPFAGEIIVATTKRRRRIDADNLNKATWDFMQRAAIIANDSQCVDCRIRYGNPEDAPMGIRIIIKPLDKEN